MQARTLIILALLYVAAKNVSQPTECYCDSADRIAICDRMMTVEESGCTSARKVLLNARAIGKQLAAFAFDRNVSASVSFTGSATITPTSATFASNGSSAAPTLISASFTVLTTTNAAVLAALLGSLLLAAACLGCLRRSPKKHRAPRRRAVGTGRSRSKKRKRRGAESLVMSSDEDDGPPPPAGTGEPTRAAEVEVGARPPPTAPYRRMPELTPELNSMGLEEEAPEASGRGGRKRRLKPLCCCPLCRPPKPSAKQLVAGQPTGYVNAAFSDDEEAQSLV